LERERVIEAFPYGEDQHEVVRAFLSRDFQPADKAAATLVKIIDPVVGAQWFAPWPMPQAKPTNAQAKTSEEK
jgi:hypothetical protein